MRANRPADIEPIGPIYRGQDFDDSEAEEALNAFRGRTRIRYDYVEDIEQRAADIIARGEGRLESERSAGVWRNGSGESLKTSRCQRSYDYTLRPREVTEAFNPDFYWLIKHCEERTGEKIVSTLRSTYTAV